jgi:hypothetical protein
MGKTMEKDAVIYPLNDKKISPTAFMWPQAETAIVEKIGEKNKSQIIKASALEAIVKAKQNKDLKDAAYIKIGTLKGENNLVLRIKAKKLPKDYEDDHILVKGYKALEVSWAKENLKPQEIKIEEKPKSEEKKIKEDPKPKLDTSDTKKNLLFMEKHTAIRENGVKVVSKYLDGVKLFLNQAKLNRKGGKRMLESNQKLAHGVVENENKFAKGEFLEGRGAIPLEISQALDKDLTVQKEVSQFRKRAQEAFDKGMRLMAEARDVRNQVLAEVQQHELEVEKESAEYLKSDKLRLEQLEKLVPAIDQAVTNKFFKKLEEWPMIEKLTESGIPVMRRTKDNKAYLAYKAKYEETVEAFDAIQNFRPLISTIQKRLTLLMSGEPSKEVKEKTYAQMQRLVPINGTLKLADKNHGEFELLASACNQKWEQLLSELN